MHSDVEVLLACFGSALPFPGDMHSLDASFIVTNYVVTLQASIIALG